MGSLVVASSRGVKFTGRCQLNNMSTGKCTLIYHQNDNGVWVETFATILEVLQK